MLQEAILKIINTNLTEEQKEALLKELANESIKKQQAENSFEAKREQLIEKNRQKAQETRERLEQYQKEAYKKEIIANSDKEVQKYIEELSKIKNNRGESIYKDLEQEYKEGKITKQEIYDLYEKIFNKKQSVYEDIFKGINDNANQDKKDNLSKGKPENSPEISEENLSKTNLESEGPLSLEEAADEMTVDEMNTILNMVSAETKDDQILNDIANRLRVSPDSLEEIAKLKEQNLKQNENQNSETSSSSDENKEETENQTTPPVDTTPEEKKKVTAITKAKSWLKSKVNANNAKALIAIAGGIAALALALINAPAAVAALAAGYTYNEFNKGAKGR